MSRTECSHRYYTVPHFSSMRNRGLFWDVLLASREQRSLLQGERVFLRAIPTGRDAVAPWPCHGTKNEVSAQLFTRWNCATWANVLPAPRRRPRFMPKPRFLSTRAPIWNEIGVSAQFEANRAVGAERLPRSRAKGPREITSEPRFCSTRLREYHTPIGTKGI